MIAMPSAPALAYLGIGYVALYGVWTTQLAPRIRARASTASA